ncbi:hypothetical protein [Rubellimicrobium roseum]|uniref:Integral membrane protein n=1 Tax=Rubellimicrobium roseum TaxID=687525 RepID=A0A5C4N883_9RHOB|nr:hypothetical protein [Rubellimicrobium roseum]TNC63997.1 hypothetical protein FHG71_18850 [Rubellimicrobium roseum]
MTGFSARPDLRLILRVDGAACLVMGAGLATLASPLGALTDMPPAFLRATGLLLVPIATIILAIASRSRIPARGVALIVAGNTAWVVASLALPLLGLIQPNALGWMLLLGQAAAVAGLAGLEQAHRPGRRTRMSEA